MPPRTAGAPPSTTLLTLPRCIMECCVLPSLDLVDYLSLSSANRSLRILCLSPFLWRDRESSGRCPCTCRTLPCLSPLLSLYDAVQIVSTSAHPEQLVKFSSLIHFPNLRHVFVYRPISPSEDERPLFAPCSVTSLSSLRHLTRIRLSHGGLLDVWDMKLLSTLPTLTSFAIYSMKFSDGPGHTVSEWTAIGRRGLKRKEWDTTSLRQVDDNDLSCDRYAEQKQVTDETRLDADDWGDRNGTLHTPLLLFLYALSAKPSFVHLVIQCRGLTRSVMDKMPVWPYLRCLDIWDIPALRKYSFNNAAHCYPSLTSLSTSDCTDSAYSNIVQLSKLEELRLPEYSAPAGGNGVPVWTMESTFRTLSRSSSLRSVQCNPSWGQSRSRGQINDGQMPPLQMLTALFTLTNLVRLTLPACWLPEQVCQQLFSHHFVHLRCLELSGGHAYGEVHHDVPQTDAALMPLVKPAGVIVLGREETQMARAARRLDQVEEICPATTINGSEEEEDRYIIAKGNGANFHSLECFSFPHYCNCEQHELNHNGSEEGMDEINLEDGTVQVSSWMWQQLRRSFEYDRVEEWEAEMNALGEAELLKSIA